MGEARNVPKSSRGAFCEILVGRREENFPFRQVGRTPSVSKETEPFWGESFTVYVLDPFGRVLFIFRSMSPMEVVLVFQIWTEGKRKNAKLLCSYALDLGTVPASTPTEEW